MTVNVATAATPDALPDVAGLERLPVLSVEHYTDSLFSFSLARPPGLRFRSGEFVMLGLPADGKPLLRAYSIASPSWDDRLEFYSIKVPDGPLTSRLQTISPGDGVYLRPRPTGTLVLDALEPGRRLVCLATGTGIAPFASIVRDPETYERFEEVVLVETCRQKADLAYGEDLFASIGADPLLSEIVGESLTFVTTLTRAPHPVEGRITTLIEEGRFADVAGTPLDPASDRVMLCGSSAFLADVAHLLKARGFVEGANNRPASYVIEKAFVG